MKEERKEGGKRKRECLNQPEQILFATKKTDIKNKNCTPKSNVSGNNL